MDLHLHIFVRSLKPDRKCTTATLGVGTHFVGRLQVSAGRSTRSSELLHIPLYKTKSGQRTFFYLIVSLRNSLDIPLNSVTLLVILSVNLEPNYLLLCYLIGLSLYHIHFIVFFLSFCFSCNSIEYLLTF